MATKLALTPAVTGAALFALTAAPLRFRDPLLAQLRDYLSTNSISRLVTALKWLFALGVISDVSGWLSDLAQNNFRLRSERARYDWKNEIAIVTGAASGFGRLITKDLASHGVNVMALDIRDELPDDMRGNLKIHYYKCDITDHDSVLAVAEQIRQRFGDASILVNNAGVVDDHTVLGAPEQAVRAVFNVNVASHWNTVQAFLPAMLANKKGHVVTIASMASFVGVPRMGVYASSKAAVMAFHETMQAECRALYNAPEIKFTIVHPTFAATPMIAGHQEQLLASGSLVLEPHVVSDAVVNQIMAAKSRQIILNGPMGFLANIRSWPHFIRGLLFMLAETRTKKLEALLSKK